MSFLINCIRACFDSNCCEDREADQVVLEVSKNQDVANAALNYVKHVTKDMSIPELTVETPENHISHPKTDQNKKYLGSHSVSKSKSNQPKEDMHNPNFLFPDYRARPSRSVMARSFLVETDALEDDFPFDRPDDKHNDNDFSLRLYLPSAVPDQEETLTDELELSVRQFN